MEQKGPHTAPTTNPVVQFYSTWYFQDLSARSCLSFPLITKELEVSISQTEVCYRHVCLWQYIMACNTMKTALAKV